jgi:hypothetical protein
MPFLLNFLAELKIPFQLQSLLLDYKLTLRNIFNVDLFCHLLDKKFLLLMQMRRRWQKSVANKDRAFQTIYRLVFNFLYESSVDKHPFLHSAVAIYSSPVPSPMSIFELALVNSFVLFSDPAESIWLPSVIDLPMVFQSF